MNNLEEFNYINELFDSYGSLLSKTQYEMLEQYYGYNLSLGEIADSLSISRTAVNDALKKGIAKCKDFESKLHLVEKKHKINELLDSDSSNIKDEIRKVINDGI